MKQLARSLLPMWLYRRLARLYAYLLAWREGPAFLWVMAFGSGEHTHQFRALSRPFTFRLTSEDKNIVFGNVIKGEVLEGPLPAEARFIVDAGGYIGDSAALFLSRYPNARCVVLEPGIAYSWAALNLERYGARAVLHQAALMSSPGFCRVQEADTGSEAHADVNGTIKAITVTEILATSPHGRIDILKVDIEGAEVALFQSAAEWLPFVDCITIELHGERAKTEIPSQLQAAGFSISHHGSLTVAVRTNQQAQR
jgi:FkbM family methyltransferase